MDYEAFDKGALLEALLALRVCPKCRQDLKPVDNLEDIWGCMGDSVVGNHKPETWYLEESK